MDLSIILLANGVFLILILFILFIISLSSNPKKRTEVEEDLSRIKEQINVPGE